MTQAPAPRLSVRHLVKRFGTLVANDDISLDVMPGELHCLLGENGAGKSTLSSCLYGLYHPDSGEIRVDGRAVRLDSPAHAIAAGLGMVHQHFVLVPGFTVLENIAVGTGSGWRLDQGAVRRRIRALCDAYGIDLDPDRQVADLSVGGQQWVEIVKVLYQGARFLILDEPTAVLTPAESRRLFAVLGRLRADGIAVLLISHKMAEVMQSDRVSVLRKGKLVATRRTADTDRDALTALMVGRQVAPPARAARAPPAAQTVLDVAGLARRRGQRQALDGVSFTIRRGEILGLAGISGNGQDALFECLAGLDVPDAGTIALDGAPLGGRGAAAVAALGVGHVPGDRFRDGLVADMDIAGNLVLGRQWRAPWRRGPFLDRAAMAAHAREAIAAHAIVAARGPETPCGRLSGGNAQKVILAREFAKARRLLLCNQPTRGLDVGAIEFVHRELARKRDEGCAILLASEELDDLFALSDRIGVMFRGRLMAVLEARATTPETIGRLMAGQAGAAA